MSIHSSLRSGGKGNKHRSVLKRYERLKSLKEKGLWAEEKSVLGIPKVKMQRIKIRKEKSTAESAAANVAAGKPTEAPVAAAAPAKGAAPIKGAAAKSEKK